MSPNNISKNDENFLKEFLKEFYRKIINLENYIKYEELLSDWIQNFFIEKEKDTKIILKLMENHEENENWFSSIIGFFYENGINNDNIIIDKNKSLKLYSLVSIYNDKKNKNLISTHQILNIIISKYLLSFYYYKDILYKKDLIAKEFRNSEIANVMSYNQFESFNGLEISICNDEINYIEKYFESFVKDSNESQNVKKKELMELNNLGYLYQYGIGKKKDEFKAFEFYLESAEGGNSDALNNLGYCYQNGIGIEKDEKKAFEWSKKRQRKSF
ncbi:unnamed protein product [Rhizophagus irregularis]|nr:unnamed protein product [Rhizophagus irregularis]